MSTCTHPECQKDSVGVKLECRFPSTRVSFAAIQEDGTWDQLTVSVPHEHSSGVCPEHSAMAWFMGNCAGRKTIQCAVLDWNVPEED